MSFRIRYRSFGSGVESVQVFAHETNGAQYKVRIVNPTASDNAYHWLVVDAETEVVAISGSHVKRVQAQREARNALETLGIRVQREMRLKSSSDSAALSA